METRHPVQFSLEYPDRDLAPRCATIPSLSMPRFAPQRGRLLARLPRVALGGEEIPDRVRGRGGGLG